jgi:hypothetical protein
MITNEMRCPCCNGELIYGIVGTNDEFNKTTETHTWICEECSLVMFEYYTSENIKGLKKRLKES